MCFGSLILISIYMCCVVELNQVCGPNRRALVMKASDRSHQSGREFAKMISIPNSIATGTVVLP